MEALTALNTADDTTVAAFLAKAALQPPTQAEAAPIAAALQPAASADTDGNIRGEESQEAGTTDRLGVNGSGGAGNDKGDAGAGSSVARDSRSAGQMRERGPSVLSVD